MRIDLGTTDDPPEGFDLYVDIVPNPKVPAGKFVEVDLAKKWPWRTGSVEHLRAFDLIEHLPDKIRTMNEAWRVLKHEGTFHILVPTTEGVGAWCDPTHVSYWNRASFDYFTEGTPERERFAKHYGIVASFKVNSEARKERRIIYASGEMKVVYLEVMLEAVKTGA